MVALFYAGFVGLAGAAFALADAGPFAFAGLVAAAGHLAWQAATLDPFDAGNCLTRFRANRTTGWIVFLGLALDAALRV
jgi:4-hydroxybenzoate polyprenyltransferase